MSRRHPWRKLSAELDACGAVCIRQSKSMIFRLPNGRMFSVPYTPGDQRAERNALSCLHRALNMVSFTEVRR